LSIGAGASSLFAFDFHRSLDQLGGHFSQLFLRFSVRDLDSELPTCVGLPRK
jgi:hypothetical protein